MNVETIGLESVLARILNDQRYREGIKYGEPRKGHSEGSVENHIIELEGNLLKLGSLLDEDEKIKLLILIHTHDSFKLWAKRDSPIDDVNSHATLAKNFLAEFTDDEDLLAMVQWHDENFALWKQKKYKGFYNEGRLNDRVLKIKDMDLFLIFTIIDGCTVSKLELSQAVENKWGEKLRWFINEVNKYVKTPRAYKALEVFGL